MGLTRITSDGITDATIATADLADQSVTLAKLPHGTSSNDGKFLRANNGADPTFETVNTDLVSDTSPQLGGDLQSNGNDIDFADNDKAIFGTGNDLQIYHNGTFSFIDNDTGNLAINTASGEVQINKDTSEYMARFICDGAVELYYDSSKKFETTSVGFTAGTLSTSSASSFMTISDSSAYGLNIQQSNSKDIQIRTDGPSIYLGSVTGEKFVYCLNNGAVELYHNNSKKFETTNSGIDVTGRITTDSITIQDDGSSEPLLHLRADDGSPWAFLISNDNYHSGTTTGLKWYVANNGNAYQHLQGNGTFEEFHLQQSNGGGTTNTAIKLNTSRGVELNYQGSKKFETRSDGVSVFDELSVGTADIQQSSVASFVGGQYNQVNIADGSNSGWGLLLAQQQGTNSSSLYTYSTNSSTNKPCSVVNVQNDALHFGTNNTARFRIEHDGHVLPSANNTYDLGSSSYRWRNIYTNDLNLSNEGSSNDVDGTWGSYTIQEGAEDLFLINKRNGKKYKFNLTEVS